jgi:hypothetical protein
MAASGPTMVSYIIRDFRPEIRGDDAARAALFAQEEPGRPFFYATDDPDQIGFIYADKYGGVFLHKLYAMSHFSDEIVTVRLLGYLGLECAEATLPHLMAQYNVTCHPEFPHFRPSSDRDGISLTYETRGERFNVRLMFYMGTNESPIPVTVADLQHVYGSAYNRYLRFISHPRS